MTDDPVECPEALNKSKIFSDTTFVTLRATPLPVDWQAAQKRAARTARWAITMTKVRIRQVLSPTRWQLVTFCGEGGGESRGIVDLLAVRKDHRTPREGTKRGDHLDIILIQVKGGTAAMPTVDDGKRLRAVAKRLHARHVLLATWRKGSPARFFEYSARANGNSPRWREVSDLDAVFR